MTPKQQRLDEFVVARTRLDRRIVAMGGPPSTPSVPPPILAVPEPELEPDPRPQWQIVAAENQRILLVAFLAGTRHLRHHDTNRWDRMAGVR